MPGPVRSALPVCLGIVCCGGMAASSAIASDSMRPHTAYLLGCGGCHGEHGQSSPAIVPDLWRQIGYYLCTPAGREYLVRLPNVAFARLSSADLTRLINYMVFDLGQGSAPKNATPYKIEEVAALRQKPFAMTDFIAYRQSVVAGVVKVCPTAASLSSFSPSSPYVTSLRPSASIAGEK